MKEQEKRAHSKKFKIIITLVSVIICAAVICGGYVLIENINFQSEYYSIYVTFDNCLKDYDELMLMPEVPKDGKPISAEMKNEYIKRYKDLNKKYYEGNQNDFGIKQYTTIDGMWNGEGYFKGYQRIPFKFKIFKDPFKNEIRLKFQYVETFDAIGNVTLVDIGGGRMDRSPENKSDKEFKDVSYYTEDMIVEKVNGQWKIKQIVGNGINNLPNGIFVKSSSSAPNIQ